MNKKDTTLKLSLYESVGIREYWVADPFKNMVTPYRLNDQGKYQPLRVNPFAQGEKIPVGIFSDLTVDLEEVFGG